MSDKEIEFVATVFHDWTTLQLQDGRTFGFNRESGMVYKIPHPECPFLTIHDRQEGRTNDD